MNKDLPLCANTDDYLVKHYRIILECHLDTKQFSGSVELILDFSSTQCSCGTENLFICILDCKDIIVSNVESTESRRKLSFQMNTWSLKFWVENVTCWHSFPKNVKIFYHTIPDGESLMWVKDQESNPCVFTYGSWINNRSLFPCQEPPIVMASWEATIRVKQPAIVLMSGDDKPKLTSSKEGFSDYFYETKSALPMSTLAIAVGYWKEHTINSITFPLCSLFATPSLLPQAIEEFSDYLPKSIAALEKHLGKYPFPRIDVLIVPAGFGSLGMANPNILFLSQTVIAGDGSMCPRLSHEVAHSWFGLLIGALDWTEEWLSEGFATFLEDPIHCQAVKMSPSVAKDFCQLRSWLRFRTLEAEVEQTEEELQMLRPTKGQELKSSLDGASVTMVKNGMNPEKAFLQVHYIKGYFLLNHLSGKVGLEKFYSFLKNYVDLYRGHLVHSTQFLKLFVDQFPEVTENGKEVTVDTLVNEWLDSPNLPKNNTEQFSVLTGNLLYKDVIHELEKWKTVNKSCLKRTAKRTLDFNCVQFELFPFTEQLVVLLELLLEEQRIDRRVLQHIKAIYQLEKRNAEVRHRWCELVVKHRYHLGYRDVKNFITDDLAMGVYLYNEMLFSKVKSQVLLAKECFSSLKDEMEPNYRLTITQMIE